jgi:eukaryotic-like serine/threonine-protein kinase
MEYSVQNLCGFLIRSRLLTMDEVKATFQRWQSEAGDTATQSGRFMKWLVARRYITEYQANLIGRGLPDNFFIGQYRLLDRIGQGSMAGVYRAVHPLGQEVAIKVLPPSRAKNPRLLGRFQREARLALRLKHPNIVRAFHVGEADGLHYIVMEYLEGETLDDVLARRGRLPPPEAVRLIYQVLAGLQHIHEQGLVHRDLKPANFMLVPLRPSSSPDTTADLTVKILDIGLGRALFDETLAAEPDKEMLTGEGVLLGTPNYLAPEQARDAHNVDIRADIYSLGCVLYHVLAGQPPFPDTNALSQMVRHVSETPRPLREFNPEVAEGLQQIIDWMMAKDPNQRYPTPERAAQALQVYLASGGGPLETLEANPKTRVYLKWLEKADGAAAPPAEPPARETTAAPATVAAAATATAAPVEKHRSGRKRPRPHAAAKEAGVVTAARRPEKHKTEAAVPVPTETKEKVFDVELVPLPEPPQAILYGLSKRDLIMLGIGTGGALLILGLGYALVLLVLLVVS